VRHWIALIAVAAAGCGGAMADGEPGTAATAEQLAPKHKRGWEALDDAAKLQVAALADDYAAWLADAKTPRRAVTGLIALASKHGATALDDDAAPAAGKSFYLVAPGGDAVAFVRVGARPVEEGVRIAIASVDAPHLKLKQQPVYEDAALAMLDTRPYGDIDLASWLVHPLALYVYAARPGAVGKAVEIVVGEDDADPVLVVPDLLPHLARHVQHRAIVDSPERMNAVAAASTAALAGELAARGIDEDTFRDADAVLVPAGPPRFIGVDRALIAGYGHSNRALAFAAVRGLFDGDPPTHTAIVLAVSRSHAGDEGNSSTMAFAPSAMSQVLRALASDGGALDVLGVRRVYASSAALVAAPTGGVRNRGIAINPRRDDALPGALRRAIDSFEAAGAQWQISDEKPARGAVSRDLGTLDLDVVDVGLPTSGAGEPLELMSTLDLYQGYLACRAWFLR
jgi:aspartyl aminopeptidase